MMMEGRTLLSTFMVTSTADDSGSGTLRWAIAQANAAIGSSTIAFDPAVFAKRQTIKLTAGQLALTNTTGTETITGPAAGVAVQASQGRVFEIDNGVSTVVSGVTIMGGSSDRGGGMLVLGGSSVALSDCIVTGNLARSYGGGLYNDGGTMTLAHCTITGDDAGTSGGGVFDKIGALTLNDCTVSDDQAEGSGGGVRNVAGLVTLTDCTISANRAAVGNGGGLENSGLIALSGCIVSDNYADHGAGGINNLQGKMTLTDCTVNHNTVEDGPAGGIWNSRGTVTLTDCAVTANVARRGVGGGLLNASGVMTLTNVTVSGNSADVVGGGLSNEGELSLTNATVTGNSAPQGGGLESSLGATTADLTNTIVAGNTRDSGASDIVVQSGSFSGSHNLIGTGGSGGLRNGVGGNLVGVANPGLAPLGSYGGPTLTVALLPGSPAINSGTSGAGIPTTDQRGEPRVGAPDIGAFESQGFTLTIPPGSSPQQTAIGTPFENALSLVIKANNAAEPTRGGTVTISAPTKGASATLSPDGIVTIGADGRASVTATANATAGSYGVSVSTAGGTPVAFDLTNLKVFPTISQFSSLNPSVFGEDVTFTATLTGPVPASGTPTGSVVFEDGSTPLGTAALSAGAAKLMVAGLSAGAHRITAVYSGDSNFLAGASAPLNQTVNRDETSTFIVSSSDPSVAGQPVTFAATVSAAGMGAGIPNGSVTFEDGADVLGTAPLSGGHASLTTTALPPGAHAITAVYNSGVNFMPSTSAPLTQTVAPVGTTALTVTKARDDGSAGTLRWAVDQANVNSGPNAIYFDPTVFAAPTAIDLIAGPLALTNPKGPQSITGPAAGVTLSGDDLSRVISIGPDVIASLSGLTITGGQADDGAGVSAGAGSRLTLTDCTVSGNAATKAGGGLDSDGALTLTDCVISGNTAGDSGGGLYNNGGTITLTGSTLIANSAESLGGGLCNARGGMTLVACIVASNSATRSGGGLFNDGTLTVTRSTVSGNRAALVGGGLGSEFGTVTLIASTVNGNSSTRSSGGGLWTSAPATLTDCTIVGNDAAGGGGGVDSNASLALSDCTISHNSAIFGGGLDIDASAIIMNCTVSGNSAENGGGLGNRAATLTLIDDTVDDNSASRGGGGGLYNLMGATLLTNSIVAENTSGSSPNDIFVTFGSVSGSYNLIGTGGSGGLQNGVDGNLVGVANPGLAPLGSYGGPTQTIALLPGSPAIDAGTSGPGIPDTDQRGEPRVGAPDIGAFESQGFTLTIVPGSSPQHTAVGAPFAHPLAVVVTAKIPLEPVAGGTVTFAAPTTGASALLSPGGSVQIGANGQASVTAVVNATAGSYVVSAAAAGAAPVVFDLTNTGATAPQAALPQSSGGFAQVSANVVDDVLGDLAGESSTALDSDAMALDHRDAPSRGARHASREDSR
jgi:hypothetical protein